MRNRTVCHGIWVIFLFLCVVPAAVLSNPGQLYSQDITDQAVSGGEEQVLDVPEGIIISYDEDMAPISYKENGKISGILVEIMNYILAERLGLNVEHLGCSERRVRFLVKTEKSDAFCVAPAKGTQEYAWFTATPVLKSPCALFTGADNPRSEEIGTVSTMAGMRDFSQVDYLGSAWARKTFPKDMQDSIHWVGTLETALKMLAINRYDIYVGDEIIGRYTLAKAGLADYVFVRRVSMGKPLVLYFGLRKSYPDAQRIIADVERILNEAETGDTINRLIEKYTAVPPLNLQETYQ